MAPLTEGRSPIYDHSLYLRTVSEFSSLLLTPYGVDAVLRDLMTRLVDTFGLAGSGVALARDGRLEYATAIPERVVALEQCQTRFQAGPCIEAYLNGEVVAVSDLAARAEEWPDYCAVADGAGLSSVAGLPMLLNGTPTGAVNLYATETREWPEEDLDAAVVMANMATSYLVNASKLRQHEQFNEQLLRSLDSRPVIDQAKGVMSATQGVSVDEAFELIRRHARSRQVTVLAVSDAIVNNGLRLEP